MSGRVQPGDVLDGKYAVERVIGQGGTGYVVAAQHLVLRRRVALKFLRPELAAQPELGTRFLREAQSAAQMTGDHVARVLDADTLSTGEPYLVMEFLEGEDLAAVLRRSGPLSIQDATDYMLQACEAVREAHAHGVVHRDLKPANLFLTRGPEGEPRLKVLDFGLSKVLSEGAGQSLTGSDHVVGSPHFMSPEQIRTPREVDQRSDIWALGATLFTMLTGRVPFDGRSMIEVCGALLCGPPPCLRRFREDVPEALEQIVLRCLRVEAAERFASVTELARALAPFAPARRSAPDCPVDGRPAVSDAGSVVTASRDRAPTGRPPPPVRVAVVLGAVALAGVALLAAFRPRLAPPPDGSAPSAEARVAPPPPGTNPEMNARASDSTPRSPAPADSPRDDAAPRLSEPTANADAGSGLPRRCVPPLSCERAEPPARVPRSRSTRPCPDPFYVDEHGIKTIRPECL
jgi:serine/threonine-protein kinase